MNRTWENILAGENFESQGQWFAAAAQVFLFESFLKVGKQEFELEDIEFFLNSPSHPDPFCQINDHLKTHGQWSFLKNGEGLREGKSRGLMISFGPHNAFGGIIIMAVRNKLTGQLFEGPSKVLGEFLSILGFEKVGDLVEVLERNIFENDLMGIHDVKGSKGKFWASPRNHLKTNIEWDNSRIMYASAAYRFTREPLQVQSGKPLLALSFYLKGRKDDIQDQLNISHNVFQKYLQHFEMGRREGIVLVRELSDHKNSYLPLYIIGAGYHLQDQEENNDGHRVVTLDGLYLQKIVKQWEDFQIAWYDLQSRINMEHSSSPMQDLAHFHEEIHKLVDPLLQVVKNGLPNQHMDPNHECGPSHIKDSFAQIKTHMAQIELKELTPPELNRYFGESPHWKAVLKHLLQLASLKLPSEEQKEAS